MLAIPSARTALAITLLAGAFASPGKAQVNPRALAAELGCAGCHMGVPMSLATTRAPAFGEGADPLPGEFVFDYLADPQRRRTDIGATRMPDFRLDEAERTALALFLGTGAPSGALADAVERHPNADADAGEAVFRILGCASCHAHPGIQPARVGPDLTREGARARPDWLGAFLRDPTPIRGPGRANHPGARMPDFRLSDSEADALAGYLLTLAPSNPWTPEPLTPFQMQRTEALVRDRLACLGCHTLDGAGGRVGPSLDGIAERLRPSYVRLMISNPQRAVPGSGMPRQHLPARDAARIATYLLQRGGSWAGTPAVAHLGGLAGAPTGSSPASLADATSPARRLTPGPDATPAETLYLRHCAACHGESGDGNGFNAPNLPVPPTAHADAGLMSLRPDDTLFDGIHAGAWVLDGSNRMPVFGELLTAAEIRSLVGYIRTVCECAGPAWSRDGRGG